MSIVVVVEVNVRVAVEIVVDFAVDAVVVVSPTDPQAGLGPEWHSQPMDFPFGAARG